MNTKLFVRNLSWSVTEADLTTLFGNVAEVVSVKIPTRREDGKPRGFAFVEMASSEGAQSAIDQCHGFMLHNREISVDFQDETKTRAGGSMGGQSKPHVGGGEKNPKLFVRNISHSVTEQDLQVLFEQAGTVVSIKIPQDRMTGQSKGFGFIEMFSADEAEEALNRLNNYELQGRALIVAYQDPNREQQRGNTSRRSFSGGGQGGGGYDEYAMFPQEDVHYRKQRYQHQGW
ncbi:MAG: RNA recognition motif domain-containing protein [Vampirovibrionales bacterium]